MSRINVNNLTFHYEGSFDMIFENVNFALDTDWKLGFVGRNGKGKTTFLNLLLRKYEYEGTISSSCIFDYFPYSISNEDMKLCFSELINKIKPDTEEWRVICELDKLEVDAEVLYRPFHTLSFGERTKVMLATLFSGENDFLLVDEPTNHLDYKTREVVKTYLSHKKGFILVSHDRDLLDACIDHVLVLNRQTIEVQSGNFTSWWENKLCKDNFAKMENEKHIREIKSLKASADRSNRWAIKNESTKIGFDPIKEPDRFLDTRCHIGAKTKKTQKRVKLFEKRMEKEIEEKEGLLKDIENPVDLKITPLEHYKEVYVSAKEYGLTYTGSDKNVLNNFNFELCKGERVLLHGENGCGKSSLIKAVLAKVVQSDNMGKHLGRLDTDLVDFRENIMESGSLRVASNLDISYIDQDTSFLKGDLKSLCEQKSLDYSLLLSILKQLDFERVQFEKNMEEYSEGQKKKVLIAASLLTPAHLFIWDEPLNYIDVFSRMQMEKLILTYQPTMLLVEHDIRFQEKIATRVVSF